MPSGRLSAFLRRAAVVPLSATLLFGANYGLTPGGATLKSAGPLAFGPDGVLFVGDFIGGSVVAIDTEDLKKGTSSTVEVKGVSDKIAALLGTSADQILINDMAVNPVSKNVYFSVCRGRGPDSIPVIVRVTPSGKLTELPLDTAKSASVHLPNASEGVDNRGNSRRMESITHIAFVNGRVIVAGLSNEEFSSNLRSIGFPFSTADQGANIEIFHGSHGRFETSAPIRTFVAYTINGEPNILAAYTCTPLVRIPVRELKAGRKVKGTTIAELGNRNRPLDMIVYFKDGHNYLLMANSSRGVMKMSADGLDKYTPITAQTDVKGIPYQTLKQLTGVQQLDKLDNGHAILLAGTGASLDLVTIPLTE